jgi:signal transduction histidine kinase
MEIPSSIELFIDPNLFERVFNNMITNSIQAMPDGGKIMIKSEDEDDYILIHIMDEGTGIPDEAKERIFTPLFTTKAKGTGLGLAVCKRIIEAHGGYINFESNEGKGTTFTIQLPFNIVSLLDDTALKEIQTQALPEVTW